MADYEPTNFVYLDIETLPLGEPDYEQIKTVDEWLEEAPKSYSASKRNLWAIDKAENQKDEIDKEFRKRSLNSLKGRIFCIALAYNDGEIDVVHYHKDEKHMMEEFEAWIETNVGHHIFNAAFVAHNIKKFDMLWLAQRAYKYNMSYLKRILPTGKFDKRILDTNDIFNTFAYGQYTKMDDIAEFLGIEGKGDMDGSQVYDYYLDGKYDEIEEYCKDDVRILRDIHKRML